MNLIIKISSVKDGHMITFRTHGKKVAMRIIYGSHYSSKRRQLVPYKNEVIATSSFTARMQ